jgi:hypothetical protein
VPSGMYILVCAVGAGAPPAAAASNSAPAGELSRRVCSAARPAARYLVLHLLAPHTAHHMKRVIRSDRDAALTPPSPSPCTSRASSTRDRRGGTRRARAAPRGKYLSLSCNPPCSPPQS